MMNRPLVSVIIPVYNSADFIEKSIETVLAQSYGNLDVIIVDDGSGDGTVPICEKIAENDRRVRVLKQKNQGPGIARNHGLDAALGDFICFVDSDDELKRDAIEIMLDNIDDDSDLIQCRSVKKYYDGRIDNEMWPTENRELNSTEAMSDYMWNFKPTVRFSVWAKLIRKSAIGDLRFLPIKNSEDVVFTGYLIDRCRKIKYISDTLYFVTVREGSLSRIGMSAEVIKAKIICCDELIQLIESKKEYGFLRSRAYWSKISTAIYISKTVCRCKMNRYKDIVKKMRQICRESKETVNQMPVKYKCVYYLFVNAPYLCIMLWH